MKFLAGEFDVAVIGAGHAGIEAGLAAARLGCNECFLQSRMLNRGKGPAVHSLRAQIDRRAYSTRMKHTLELQENLELRQAEITDLEQTDDGKWLLTTRLEAQYISKTVILATGTYLGGKIYVGDVSFESGPDGNVLKQVHLQECCVQA